MSPLQMGKSMSRMHTGIENTSACRSLIFFFFFFFFFLFFFRYCDHSNLSNIHRAYILYVKVMVLSFHTVFRCSICRCCHDEYLGYRTFIADDNLQVLELSNGWMELTRIT